MFYIPAWNSDDKEQENLAEKLFADVPSEPKKKRKHKEKDNVDIRPKLPKKGKSSDGAEKIDSEADPDKKLKLLMEMLEDMQKRDDQRECKEIIPCHDGKTTKKYNIKKQTADLSVFVVSSKDDVKKRKKKKRKQEKNLAVKDCLEESKTQEADKGNVCEDDSLSVSGGMSEQINQKKRKRENTLEVENSLEQSVHTDTEKNKVNNNYSLSISKTADEPIAKKMKKRKKIRKLAGGEENDDAKVEVQVVSTAEKGPSTKQNSMQRETKETSGCMGTEQHLERNDDSKSHTKTDHTMIDSKMLLCDAPSERTKSKEKDFKSKLQKKLSGAQFRWINEQLYTTESQNAFDIFSKDPKLFDIYHTGFQNQVESWPQNPVDVMIAYLNGR